MVEHGGYRGCPQAHCHNEEIGGRKSTRFIGFNNDSEELQNIVYNVLEQQKSVEERGEKMKKSCSNEESGHNPDYLSGHLPGHAGEGSGVRQG